MALYEVEFLDDHRAQIGTLPQFECQAPLPHLTAVRFSERISRQSVDSMLARLREAAEGEIFIGLIGDDVRFVRLTETKEAQ